MLTVLVFNSLTNGFTKRSLFTINFFSASKHSGGAIFLTISVIFGPKSRLRENLGLEFIFGGCYLNSVPSNNLTFPLASIKVTGLNLKPKSLSSFADFSEASLESWFSLASSALVLESGLDYLLDAVRLSRIFASSGRGGAGLARAAKSISTTNLPFGSGSGLSLPKGVALQTAPIIFLADSIIAGAPVDGLNRLHAPSLLY